MSPFDNQNASSSSSRPQSLSPFELFQSRYKFIGLTSRGALQKFELFIPNSIFKHINTSQLGSKNKALAFCAYVTIRAVMTSGEAVSAGDIREMWGYKRHNRETNEVLSKDGYLNREGITTSVTLSAAEGLTGKNKLGKGNGLIVTPEWLNVTDSFFRVPVSAMLGCMFWAQKLGPTGFYIYSFICMAEQLQQQPWAVLSYSYMSKGLGPSEKTIATYIQALEQLELIKVRHGSSKGYLEKHTNQYKPNRTWSTGTNGYLLHFPEERVVESQSQAIALNKEYSV